MMYWCPECKTFHKEEDVWKKLYPATLYEPEEWTTVCPNCGDLGSMEETNSKCEICGQYTRPDEDYCDECHNDMLDYFESHISKDWNGASLSDIIGLLVQIEGDYNKREV